MGERSMPQRLTSKTGVGHHKNRSSSRTKYISRGKYKCAIHFKNPVRGQCGTWRNQLLKENCQRTEEASLSSHRLWLQVTTGWMGEGFSMNDPALSEEEIMKLK